MRYLLSVQFSQRQSKLELVVVFPQVPFRVRMFPGQPGIIQLRNAPWPPEESRRWLCYSMCIGEVVWSFMFAVELAGSYLGHVPCKFWKVCIGLSIFHRSIMEGNWPALDVVHASVITDLFAYWALQFLHCRIPAAVIWMLLWEVFVVVPCQMAL